LASIRWLTKIVILLALIRSVIPDASVPCNIEEREIGKRIQSRIVLGNFQV